MLKYDVGIIGAGPAGVFATYKIVSNCPETKIILFDLSRPPGKRKPQCHGFFGCVPGSDGKLYLNDFDQVATITSNYKTNIAKKWVNNTLRESIDLSINKDIRPNIAIEKKINKLGFAVKLNDYIQLSPKDIHSIMKYMSSVIDMNTNITSSFDNEVFSITKKKGGFIVSSQNGDIFCKRIIICVGRSGWRWAKKIYENFDLVVNNNAAKFGIKIETSDTNLRDFNKSNCTIYNDKLEVGPLCWNGTVIPEDHTDFSIASFRSNELRWKTDKVSFNLIGSRYFENCGSDQINRIGQLTFLLSNERILKEKISTIFSRKSKISFIKEYDWLTDALINISSFVPNILSKGYFHIPTMITLPPKINIAKNLSTDIEGMYVAGESANVVGILAAMTTGTIAGNSLSK